MAEDDTARKKVPILLVDDQDAQLFGMSAVLSDLDVTIAHARSGEEALRVAGTQELALVVLDVAMPGMNGIETAAWLRQLPAERQVPVMFITANAMMEDRQLDGYAVGGVDYLFKPVNPVVFRSKVAAFAELYRQRQRLLESERQQRELQRHELIGRLVGGIAHQFNNLLTVINGNAAMLQHPEPGSSPAEALADIQVAGERAAVLTQQLLAFGRRRHLDATAVDVNQFVRSLVPPVRALAGPGIELQLDLEDGLDRVAVDRGPLAEALLELVQNSVTAMSGAGRLRIVTTATADRLHVEIAVADTGVGMPPDVASKAFEPFFTTRHPNRVGMGLSMAHGIVHQSKGSIHIDSQPGHGTTVRILLPAMPPPRTQAAAMLRPQRTASGQRPTVLVVEEEPAIQRIIARILKGAGYEVLMTGSAEAALEICEHHPRALDVILTDVMMPGMNGPELAKAASAVRPAVRVVFMSGYDASALERSGVLPRGQPLISKPFSGAALAARVRDALGEPDATKTGDERAG